MQSKEQILDGTVAAPTFKRILAPKASKDDLDAFWADLRLFYRTGIKPKKADDMEGLTSVFKSLLQNQINPYPFKIGERDVPFGPQAHFQMLGYHLANYQKDTKRNFKSKLQALIVGLSKLLSIKEDQSKNNEVFDFANEIIAFDKLSALIPQQNSPKLTESRKKRLSGILDDLNRGIEGYQNREASFLVSGDTTFESTHFEKIKIMQVPTSESIEKSLEELKKQILDFTNLIRAFRMANLEVEDEYKEEIHDEFFNHFTWYRLSAIEKSLFLPVFLVIDYESIEGKLDSLSSLLSANLPIKLLVLNKKAITQPNESISWEDASHSFRKEISTFAISHRNVYTCQCVFHDPETLSETLRQYLNTNNPALCHLLIPDGSNTDELTNSRMAEYGRHFPYLIFNPEINQAKEGRRLKIDHNDGAMQDWLSYNISIQNDEKLEENKLLLTYADYKASFDQKVNELMVVPPAFDTDYLVHTGEYLKLEADELYGKVPYVWLADSDCNLHRAAIPNVWVVSCQERLDFWHFLQEMTGDAPNAITEVPNNDVEEMIATHEQELAKVRAEATTQAAQRLIAELLSD